MSKKTVIILVVVALSLCLMTGLCAGTFVLIRMLTRGALRPSEAGVPAQTTAEPSRITAAPGLEQDQETGYGTLRLLGSLPPTLDPALAQDSTSALYIVHIFSGLVTLNAEMEVSPDIAVEWDISPDGTVYTFRLNPDAVFQDGRPITAQDVIYSLERACSPELQSPTSVSYLGDIVGVEAYAAGKAEHISGLDSPDDHTVVITIDAPKAYFLAKLTYPAAFVVDRNQVESGGTSWQLEPNGSGPFRLASISRNKIVLERNPLYYGHKASLASVEFNMGAGDPMTMYENNQLDVISVGPGDIERVLDPANPLNAELISASELSVQYLAFNTQAPPFDDPAVRQAFTMAIDRSKIADLVLMGTASAARGILPPAMPGFDETLEGLPYDPARARELLSTSRYGRDGAMPELVLATSGTSGHMDGETRAILYMLETNLGLQVRVEQVAWEDFLSDLNRQVYQMYISGWIADYPDPQNFLDLLFHSKSAQNHMGYVNKELDNLLEQARTAATPDERYALYHQAERIIINDAPWIPLTHGIEYSLAKPYVHGVSSTSSIYPWLSYVSITD